MLNNVTYGFLGDQREELDRHLENHFEHRCKKCDYTSRTEGRLKQHIQRFHQNGENAPNGMYGGVKDSG